MISIKSKVLSKKLVSLLLAMSMCLLMCSTVFSDAKESIVIDLYENPMYEGISTNSNNNEDISFYSEDELQTFDSLEEAAKYMKSKMVKRESNIELKVNTSYYKGIHKDIYDIAVDNKNASNPNEGDYIDSHMSSYHVKMLYTSKYVKFQYDVNYLTTYKEELLVDKKVKEVLQNLNVYNSSEYIKIKAVHDYIVKNIDYDYSLANHSAYNAIVEENVVCQGFASLTYRMLKELGVGVRYISGYSYGERHAWNIVKINGKWYNLDNTWDANDSSKMISYKYFLKNMSDFQNHSRDLKFLTSEFESSYSMASKSYSITNPRYNKTLTKDIYKYDIGSKKYLTSVNEKNYSQFSYLNKSGKYAFTPSSWIAAAGVTVSMPTSYNGYTMRIDNNYIEMCKDANNLLNKIKSNRISKSDIEKELKSIDNMKNKSTNTDVMVSSRASIKKSLTNDIYKYDIGKGKYLTYINGKGYSQYSYLNTSGKYAFTPSSWMTAAGLTVSMPTSSNGYTMEITNTYISKYNNLVKQIEEQI